MAWMRSVAVLAAAAAAAGCGVPQGKYEAALAETGRAMKQVADERQRADAAERKAAELRVKLSAAEQRTQALSARLGELSGAEPVPWRAPAGEADPADAPAAQGVPPGAPAAAPLPAASPAPRAEQPPRSAEYQALAASLAEEVRAGRIQLLEAQGRLTLRFAERVLFPTGSATVSSDGRRALRRAADVLRTLRGRTFRVEGHTDNIPVRTEAFPSNFELSTARAMAVVKSLEDAGLNPALLTGTGFADHLPIATNDTSEGRAQNRRIEVIVALAGPVQPQAPVKTPMIFPIGPAGP